MKDKRTSGSWRPALECLLASMSLAVLTFVSFRLHAGPAMAALLFFFLVVLISLWAGFLSTVFACAVAALCFDYFFTQPLYHLWMSEPVEIAATIAFASTALIISRLLSRVRERTAELQQTNEQLQAEIAERKRAEQAVGRSEAYLAEAQRLSHTGSFCWRVSTGEILWSEETYRIYQCDRTAEPNVELILQRVHPEDAAFLKETTERAAQDGKDMDYEHRILMPDGSVKYVHVVAHAQRDESGELEFVGAVMDVTAAKQAEERVRQDERELRRLIDAIPQHVVVLDPGGSFLYLNQVALEYSGLTLEEGLAKDALTKIFHPDDLERVVGERQQAISRGVPWDAEARIRGKDGDCRWFIIRVNPLRDEQGCILRWYGTSTDIEDRKRAEETLRGQADLLNLTHDAIFVADMEGVIKYWNHGTEERYGWTAEQAVGTVVHDLLKTVFPAPLQQIKTEVIRKGRWDGELVHTKKDGTQVVVASRWALQRDERGAPLTILETNNDITEHKRAEEALRLSNAYNRSLIEASLDPLVTIGPDGEITDVNAATEAATGRSRGELVGTDFCDYFTEPAKARASYEQVFREGMVRDYPLELRHRDGGVRSVLYNVSVYRDESGRVIGVFAAARDITERQRAEEALRESETRFRTFVDHAADALFIYDFEQGTIVDVNRQACESLGYTRQELIGTMGLAFDQNVDRAVTESIAERTAAGETVIDTHWHQRKDGTLFPVEAHTSQYWYGGRRFLLKVARDISERLRAEEERAYLASIVESSDDAIIGRSMEGIIQSWNRGAERLYGYTAQEAIGRPITMLIPPDRAEEFVSSDRLKQGEWIEEQETVRVGKDGRRIDVSVIISPMKDAAGRVVGAATIARDITERKRAQEAMRRSEAYLAEGQRLSHTGSWAFDLASNKYIYVSEENFRIFEMGAQEGLPNREAISRQIYPEDWDRVNESFEKSLREKVDTSSEFRIVLPSGTVKHLQVIRHPIMNDAGDVVELVGTLIDMTERKRAEQERERLRQLEADLAHIDRISMMGELAASVAHEVNQPLSGVVVNGNACLRWLAGDSPNLEEAREAVRRIVRDGKRAGEVITRIRALATKTATAKERLDMNETIREVIALAGDELRKNRVAVRTEFAPDLSPVLGDRVQLQQVVLNLVMNGIEAMSSVEGRPRELIARTQNDDAGQVRVTVRDSGVGLDPQAVEKIFDSFYTTKQGGMGMGLSISRSIIQNHGGRLWAVANEGPGISVQFTIPKHQQ